MTPQEALKKLEANRATIEKYGAQIREARIEFVKREAALIDAENNARERFFTGEAKDVKVSSLREWMKWETMNEAREKYHAEQKLKGLHEGFEIVIEVNNILKTQIRLMELEVHNL